MNIEKWAERIYLEEDFGKNVATTGAGVIGLCVYFYKSDFALATFVTIIVFPLIKIISNALSDKYSKEKQNLRLIEARKNIEETVKSLTGDERLVIHEFVKAGGSVISSKYIQLNKIHMPDIAVKSLMERGYLREGYYGKSGEYDLKLNIAIFEAGRSVYEK
jgi:hypothetical protein